MPNFGSARDSLTLFIFGDASGLNKTLKQTQRNVTTFSKDVEKATTRAQASTAASAGFFGRAGKGNQALRGLASGTGLGSAALFGSGAFIGAAISAGAIKASVDAASDLNEQITKTQQVFKEASAAVLDWSTTTAKSLGISRENALEAASTFGNLFSAQGFDTSQNSKLSKGLVQLAADLASFNNIDPAQVLEDLRSGIVGEIEPVRKYGADLRIARVQQEALAESGKENVKQLTQQDLTLSRLHLLYKDTSKAQGDFKRTSGGLANQQRILTAQTQDLAAKTGKLLLPVAKDLVTTLNNVATIAGQAADGLNALASVKIPPIHIPLIFDQGGGSTLGSIFDKATLTLGEFVDLTEKQITKTINDFKTKSKASTPKLAKEFSGTLGGFFKDSINGALDQAGKQKVDTSAFAGKFADSVGKSILLTGGKRLKFSESEIRQNQIKDLLDSLQLGVERSQITGSLQTQLAALEELRGGIQKQIKAGVDVKSAQHDLASVEGSIADLQKQIRQDGFNKILGDLQLGVDKASLTKGLGDDLAALEQQAAGIRAQIKAGQDVENNQSQLVSVLGAIRDKKAEIAQAASDALQAKQFRALGLSVSGDEIIPGLKNLSSRIADALKKVSSGQLDISNKLASRLKAAQNLIKKEGSALTAVTRQKIDEFIKAANGDDSKEKANGPLTATTSLNTNKILKGLGISGDAAEELRARLSHFNVAGRELSRAGVRQSNGNFPVFAGGGGITVNVELDGKQVAKSVRVTEGKRTRSNPPQKRGPQGGRI